jgi:CSLREA domain-containing protein
VTGSIQRAGICLVAFLAAALLAPSAQAAIINVDTLGDDDAPDPADCELREAVQAANINLPVDGCPHDGIPGADTINIGVMGTIALDDVGAMGTQLDAMSEMDINGLGPASTTISRDPGVLVGRIFHVTGAGNLDLTGATVSGGMLSADGPGILNEGILTLNQVKVANNQAIGADGAGISGQDGSSTTIMNSEIGPDNIADVDGGGISVEDGTLQLSNTHVVDNEAQGLADGNGGGIRLIDASVTPHDHRIIGSVIIGNDAEGIGGGLTSILLPPHTIEIESSTFSGNTASAGAGAELAGEATLLNSTFSGNTADSNGGGMRVDSNGATNVNLAHTTIAENGAPSGSGILFDGGDTLTMRSSILENPAGGGGDCAVTPPTSAGYNVVSDGTCMLGGTGDAVADPMLGVLADNGAPAAAGVPGTEVVTQTHALQPGSPAIDRSTSGPATDQRGVARPQGAFCDSGAFELEMAVAASPSCAGPAAALPVVPSNDFTFGKLRRNKKKGIAFLFVNLPGPGQIGLEGKGLKELGLASAVARKSLAVAGGRVKLKVRPAKKGKKARQLRTRLREKGKAKLKVFVTYVPTGGLANTQARKVKLLRK